MFLGLSLTTWLVLGIFAIVTPIAGKEIAKQSLEIKDSLKEYSPVIGFTFFPWNMIKGNDCVTYDLPIQIMPEHEYVFLMMAGGVYAKFLSNLIVFLFHLIAMFIIYFLLPVAKIFSTK